jgi:signal transduction histidine kinase
LAESGDVESVQKYFSDFEGITLQALKEMRLLLYQLRPPVLEQEGLVGALQKRLDTVEGRAGVEVRFLVEGEIELTAEEEEAFYGIAQEALNNALKHASATLLAVCIRSGEGRRVELEIADNGRGFDPLTCGGQGGMGLVTMQQRAEQMGGELQVLSAIGKGTKVRLIVG